MWDIVPLAYFKWWRCVLKSSQSIIHVFNWFPKHFIENNWNFLNLFQRIYFQNKILKNYY